MTAVLDIEKTQTAAKIPAAKAMTLRTSEIVPWAGNPRTDFDDDKFAELVSSIRLHGVLQPITVRRHFSYTDAMPLFEIVIGESRFRAAEAVGLKAIPAMVVEVDDENALLQALAENECRDDLKPLERAAAWRRLIADYSYTQSQIAAICGKTQSVVSQTVALLELPLAARELIATGQLSGSHGMELIALRGYAADDGIVIDYAARAVAEGWSVKELRRRANALFEPRPAEPAPSPQAHIPAEPPSDTPPPSRGETPPPKAGREEAVSKVWAVGDRVWCMVNGRDSKPGVISKVGPYNGDPCGICDVRFEDGTEITVSPTRLTRRSPAVEESETPPTAEPVVQKPPVQEAVGAEPVKARSRSGFDTCTGCGRLMMVNGRGLCANCVGAENRAADPDWGDDPASDMAELDAAPDPAELRPVYVARAGMEAAARLVALVEANDLFSRDMQLLTDAYLPGERMDVSTMIAITLMHRLDSIERHYGPKAVTSHGA